MRHIKHFLDLIRKADNILISTHIHPDADGIGGQIGLCLALRELGKNAWCVNEGPLLERYRYLDQQGVVLSVAEYAKKKHPAHVDLFIVVDANNLARVGTPVEKLVAKAGDLLFVDHHPCPKEVAAIHCIDTNMAATGELVGMLVEAMNAKFTQEIALALYTAILIDTNCFRYRNVTAHTHMMVSKLLATGIRPAHAYNQIYGTKKIGHMRLLGAILGHAQTNKDEDIAWIILSEELIQKLNVDIEDTHSFINHLLILDNVKVACMFRQVGDHVKVSLRSTGLVDVGPMAQALGGGGHDYSAATVIEGDLNEVVKSVIKKLETMMKIAQSA